MSDIPLADSWLDCASIEFSNLDLGQAARRPVVVSVLDFLFFETNRQLAFLIFVMERISEM
jgi:hypothetical protein